MTDNDNALPIEGEIVVAPAQPAGLSLGALAITGPEEVIAVASRVATALKDIVVKKKLVKEIQGKEYPFVTAWATMGAMMGVVSREVPEMTYAREDGSYIGTAELVRVTDGVVIGRASAVCGMDEKDRDGKMVWGSRPEYARRSMAVTRASGKAWRLSFSWIMVLAGYQPTPAEEMDGLNLEDHAGNKAPSKQPTQPPASEAPSRKNGKGKEREPMAPQELSAYITNKYQAYVQTMEDNHADPYELVAEDAAKKLAIQWQNITGLKTDDRHAVSLALFGAASTKDYTVALADVCRSWLTKSPVVARAEAQLALGWLNAEKAEAQ